MTEVNLNETVNGYRGSIGRLVFKKYKGRTIVSRKPVLTKEPTEGQIAHRERFKEATSFAKYAMADPLLRAFYEPIARERDMTVYTLAVADFLHEPEFKPLDLSKYQGKIGDTIVIQAMDDLGMAEVNVMISSDTGALIESGKAVEIGARSGKWVYIATAPVASGSNVFIEVTGTDHANNPAKITESPTVGVEE
jgi:hypothetical protein